MDVSKISARRGEMTSLSQLVPVLDREPRRCEVHGEYLASFYPFGGGRWSSCPACHAERVQRDVAEAFQEMRQEQAQASEAKRRKSASDMLGRAMIPPRFAGCTLESYEAENDGQKAAKARAARYVESWPDNKASGTSLILCGRPGTGKTHIAVAIAKDVMAAGDSVLFARVYELVSAVRETYRRDAEKSEREALAAFAAPDLLILDEVGHQRGSDAERLLLFEVINARYEQCKPTILISNKNLEGLRDYLDERAADRLRQGGGKVIPFDWESKRGAL